MYLASNETSDGVQVAAPCSAAAVPSCVGSSFTAYCELEELVTKELCGGGEVGTGFLAVPGGC